MIGKSTLKAPIIVAGNKTCADEVKSILESNNLNVKVVDNVFPSFLWNMGQKYADVLRLDETIENIKTLEKLEYDLLW